MFNNFFNNIFGDKKLKERLDLTELVTDMHSHLLPGIDDGAPDISVSIALIKEMQALGYKKLITTPHIMADVYKNTPEIIVEKYQLLSESVQNEGIDMEIIAAGEYLIDDGFEEIFKNKNLLTFGDNFVLIELPYYHVPPNLHEITFELQVSGYKIILAHPERYAYWHNDFEKFEGLKDRGIFFQLNIMSLSGRYSPEVKKIAEKMIDLEMIDYLGSDLHNFSYLDSLKKSLYEPYLKKALQSGLIKNHLI